MRIACVQNGDYTTASRSLRAGGPETYNGQRYTIDAFAKFVECSPSVVVSLDAVAHREQDAMQVRMSVGSIRRIRGFPCRWQLRAQARRIITALEALQTTHLLLRCVDLIGCELLEWASRRRIPTVVLIAARFDAAHPMARRFCTLANRENVCFVANHNRVATESLVECGLRPDKAIAWDLPPSIKPSQYLPRLRRDGERLRIMFAGSVERAKGIGDLVEACGRAVALGTDLQLTVCGEGRLLPGLRQHPGVARGWLQCLGRIPQSEVVNAMRVADLVAVPSRWVFPEGLPFVIQEALAVRTPLLLSDHPVFVRYFQDGNAVRLFRERDIVMLSTVLQELARDTAQCARLSEQTAAVWDSLACPTHFHHLLDRLTDQWKLSLQDNRADIVSSPDVALPTDAVPMTT